MLYNRLLSSLSIYSIMLLYRIEKVYLYSRVLLVINYIEYNIFTIPFFLERS